MKVLNIVDGKLTMELKLAELPALIDLAHIAEYHADGFYCTEADEELHPYYQEREDLTLVAGLWKSLLELALITYDQVDSTNQTLYHHARYIAHREELRGKRAADMARQVYSDEHAVRLFTDERRKETEAITDPQEGEQMLISEAGERLQKERAARLSPSALHTYGIEVKRLIEKIGDLPIQDVTLDHLLKWLDALRTQTTRYENTTARPPKAGGLSEYTIDSSVTNLKAFFNWLVKRKYLTASPAAELEYKKTRQRPPKRISDEQVKALFKAAEHHTRDYALLRLALATGLRRGGLQSVRVQDLDFTECSATVTEKGKKTRKVYFDNATKEVLQKWLKIRPTDCDHVFVTETGQPFTLSGLRQVLRRLCRKAGIPQVSLHQLRHTFAYNAVRHKIDPDLLRQQLGHADISTTYNIYVQWDDSDRRAAFGEDLLSDLTPPPPPKEVKPINRQVFRVIRRKVG